ncbi:hypothetical protein L3X38_043385 [Prunus dulcis]|uniref:Uncharacterized protein n=1 Tax=Prunus dulcis TaxID=3755 RepID=A0AAD4UY06_PRUDU|nr:hypothetical protein L3X38_043385 [Prunus dulcis]
MMPLVGHLVHKCMALVNPLHDVEESRINNEPPFPPLFCCPRSAGRSFRWPLLLGVGKFASHAILGEVTVVWLKKSVLIYSILLDLSKARNVGSRVAC